MPPLNLLIKPASSLCNMRCRYCFYADEVKNRTCSPASVMTAETLEILVKRAFEYAEGTLTLAFQGGEPTLAGLDFYRSLHDLEAKYNTRGIKVFHAIQTNGLALDDDWADFLSSDGWLVGLSLDGCREVHDAHRLDADGKATYDRVMKAARLLRRHRVDFNVLCVVTEQAARHPIRVYEALKPFGYVQFIPCLDPLDGYEQPYSLTNERYGAFLCRTFDLYCRDFHEGHYVSVRNFDNYVRLLAGYPPEECAMVGHCTCMGVVESDGSVYPCDFYALDEWRLGDIRSSSFADLLTSEKAREFVRASMKVPVECRVCPYYRLCRGGCRRERIPAPDDQPGVNRHCAALRAFFDHSIRSMSEMAMRVRNG